VTIKSSQSDRRISLPMRTCSAVTCAVFVALLITPIAAQPYQGDPRTHVIEAPNFKGRNVCTNIGSPAQIRMEAEVGRQEPDFARRAKYEITVGNVGTMTVEEEVVLDNRCASLPLDRFAWRDERDGERANAHFCLSGADGRGRIEVRASAKAGPQFRGRIKDVLMGMAACQMGIYPSQFNSDDKYSVGDKLQMGPYVLAYTPR
jgi:hypothetical protein